jgi:hypothetical protein
MHKLRINISVKPKIMINSPEVCFDISRQHAQVGHKNINIFSYKNHLGSLCRNGPQKLCAIFGTKASHDKTYNISKTWMQRSYSF